ncbi:oxidoreductase [Actinorhabdospora filicis]|uniref:Oxidoreductase n=1 Tax=Actinorhabdospora filicis TaxID=1785913 RepID=A0A9W6SQF3_9ACTN|nr:oxidoreductase [Actinorhabdospora filicis]GLZ80109.1 oxidoreductase [Actinorhabdospora filicis]
MATTTPQAPVGSGFDRHSTAEDVLQGVDLGGKTVLLTGGYSGVGLATARALSAAGAAVIVPARRPEVARAALDGVPGAETAAMDLADLGAVTAFAGAFVDSGRRLDIVINCAAVMALPERTTTAAGWEIQFAVNHLGHHVLVNRLLPAINEGGRVVAASSGSHRRSGIRWDDVHFERGEYVKWLAYGQSKTANALFALHLDHLARDRGVRAFSAHPGMIPTPLQRHLSTEEHAAAGWVDADGNIINPNVKRPEQGASTQVWAATAAVLAGHGGVYCEDTEIAVPATPGQPGPGVAAWATDPEQAERLWAYSRELTGADAFA